MKRFNVLFVSFIIAVTLFILHSSTLAQANDTIWTRMCPRGQFSRSVAFHPSGNYIATLCESGGYILWDTQSGGIIKDVAIGYPNSYGSMKFSPSGNYFSYIGTDTLRIISAVNWEEVKKIAANGCCAFSNDDNLIAVANDHILQIYDMNNWQIKKEIAHIFIDQHGYEQTAGLGDLKFSTDGKHLIYLVGGEFTPTIKILDLGTYEYKQTEQLSCSLYFDVTEDNKYIAYNPLYDDSNKIFQIYDIDNNQIIDEYKTSYSHPVTGIKFTHDGKYLLISSDSRNIIWVYDIEKKKMVYEYSFQNNPIRSIDISNDDKYIAALRSQRVAIFKNNFSTSVTEEKNSSILNIIYPNPGSSIIKINLNIENSDNYQIFISNNTGQLINSIYEGLLEFGENNFNYDISKLPIGVYFVNAISPSNKIVVKFVKEK